MGDATRVLSEVANMVVDLEDRLEALSTGYKNACARIEALQDVAGKALAVWRARYHEDIAALDALGLALREAGFKLG